jgi:hypothetical protein
LLELDQVVVADVYLRLLGEWNSRLERKLGIVPVDGVEVAAHDAQRGALARLAGYLDLGPDLVVP